MKMTYYTVYKYVSAVTIIIQHDKVKKKKANRETKTDRMIDEKLVVYYGKKVYSDAKLNTRLFSFSPHFRHSRQN